MKKKPVTKPGQYGTLYLYRVRHTDRYDDACPIFEQKIWAYNLEHAEYKFFDGVGDDDGWKIVSLSRIDEESGRHRETLHKPIRP